MELDQWIAVYGAVCQSAASHLRSRWVAFAGGLLATSLVAVLLAYLAQYGIGALERSFGIGASSLGLLVALTWLLNQSRLQIECSHWERLLRSLEEQFAGAEFYRSFDRMAQGEEICIPSTKRVCGEWHSEPVRLPKILRDLPRVLEVWIPAIFALVFAFLIVWFVLNQHSVTVVTVQCAQAIAV